MKPASFREVRRYRSKPVDSGLVEHAAKSRGLKVDEIDGALIKLQAPLNFWSFGESIDVVLGTIDGCSVVDITSTCNLRTQLIDWGKNERNVRRLFQEIDELLSGGDHERCPICKRCGYLLVGILAKTCPECGRPFSAAEAPTGQETVTFRNAIVLVVGITSVEFLVGLALFFLGFGRFIPWPMRGIWGALGLLLLNASWVLVLIGLHRLVKRFLRRS